MKAQSQERTAEQLFQIKSRYKAAFWVCLLHVLCLIALLWTTVREPEINFVPLASMDFSPYDPEGGAPGGRSAPESPKVPEPTQKVEEPLPQKEPDELTVVESKAETAEAIAPQVKKKAKKKVLKKVKPVPTPTQATSSSASEMGGGKSSLGGAGKGGSGGGTGRGNPDVEKAYLAQIVKKLNRHKKYPSVARSKRLSGTVVVRFTINSQGRVVQSHMIKGSGFPALDQEAMALVQRVSPFKAIPEAMHKNTLSLTVPIRFSVRQ